MASFTNSNRSPQENFAAVRRFPSFLLDAFPVLRFVPLFNVSSSVHVDLAPR